VQIVQKNGKAVGTEADEKLKETGAVVGVFADHRTAC